MLEKSSRPIFIVGSPRSGTTILRLLLDSHPNISCGPESKFLIDINNLVCDKYWHAVTEFGFDKSYWQLKNAQYFSDFQYEYAYKRGKKRWAEKTPAYSMNIETINELFPNCQFIHIIRDGYDVLASVIRKWGYIRGVKFLLLYKWKKHIKKCQSFGVNVGSERYIEIRYENLVKDPEVTLKKLFEGFLHETWSEEILRYQDFPHDGEGWDNFPKQSRHRDMKIYSTSIGLGKKELNPLIKTLFQLSSQDLLNDLGY